MKKYLIIFAALAMGGCKKFLDVNVNPNTATTTPANYVFTNAQARTASNQVGGVHTMAGSWVGFYGHSTSFTGGGQEKTYVFTNNDFNYWNGMYDNLADYQLVVNNAEEDGVGFLVGPAKVMKAYVFQKLVDLYGNIPYTEALQGTAFLEPKYDNAQSVYEDLIVQLTQAIADMKAGSWPLSNSSDIMFKGNKAMWLKFANTLKMRILMRQSNMSGRDGYITTEINKIITEGSGFLTENAYVQPGYLKSVGKMNPFYTNYGYTETDAQTGTYAYRRLGAVAVNFLAATGDLFRLSKIARPKPGGNAGLFSDYVGIPLGGGGNAYLESATSPIGSMAIVQGEANRPIVLMSASEAFFLKAEAAQRYGIAGLGSARSNYEDGVREAFRLAAGSYLGTTTSYGLALSGAPSASDAVATAEANTYLASGQPLVDWDDSPDKLRTIWVQKYFALIHIDGLEAWSEYRRTSSGTSSGLAPTNPQSVATTSAQPVRLYYPKTEENVNSKNYVAVNVFTSKIFWDVN